MTSYDTELYYRTSHCHIVGISLQQLMAFGWSEGVQLMCWTASNLIVERLASIAMSFSSGDVISKFLLATRRHYTRLSDKFLSHENCCTSIGNKYWVLVLGTSTAYKCRITDTPSTSLFFTEHMSSNHQSSVHFFIIPVSTPVLWSQKDNSIVSVFI